MRGHSRCRQRVPNQLLRSSPCSLPTQVQEILGDQPEVKEKMFAILKQYAAERKVDYLAYALAMVLTKESQHPLLDNIRYLATLLYGHFARDTKLRAEGVWSAFIAFCLLFYTCVSWDCELVWGWVGLAGGGGGNGKHAHRWP